MANLMMAPMQPEQRPRLMLIKRINSQELIPDCKDSSEWMKVWNHNTYTRNILSNQPFPSWHASERLTWGTNHYNVRWIFTPLAWCIQRSNSCNCNIIYHTVQIIFFSKFMGVITSLPSATKWYYIRTFPDLMPKKRETIGTLCVHDKGITVPIIVWFLNFSKSFFHQKVLCNYLCL